MRQMSVAEGETTGVAVVPFVFQYANARESTPAARTRAVR